MSSQMPSPMTSEQRVTWKDEWHLDLVSGRVVVLSVNTVTACGPYETFEETPIGLEITYRDGRRDVWPWVQIVRARFIPRLPA